MIKPSPIAIVALSIAALSILAFTINEALKNRKSSDSSIAIASKNIPVKSPFVAAYNPAHGEPGHRHDLPDGAPLPNSTPIPAATTTNDLALSNTASQPASEIASTAEANPAHGQPGHRCDIAVGAPLNSTPPNANAVATAKTPDTSGKNPAHGQPGHRCDIAVGAPLNSVPVKTTTTNSIANTTTPVVTNNANNATGLNPAHGQPGHRCDIAVGAPLNSPAKSTNSTPTKSNTLNPSVFPNYNFPKNDSASTTAPQFQYDSTGAALNPAHGQPGHDCSIAVGKPLKK